MTTLIILLALAGPNGPQDNIAHDTDNIARFYGAGQGILAPAWMWFLLGALVGMLFMHFWVRHGKS